MFTFVCAHYPSFAAKALNLSKLGKEKYWMDETCWEVVVVTMSDDVKSV
jgi:hypothetical protein